jgi:hypothetical protein
MAEEPDNLALGMLRRMDGKLDRLVDDVRVDRIGRRLDLVEH